MLKRVDDTSQYVLPAARRSGGLSGGPKDICARGDVFVWLLSISEIPFHAQLENLTKAELMKVNEFRRGEDFKRFVKSRGVLRAILASLTEMAPQRLAIIDHCTKPYATNIPGLHFNQSRSNGYLVIAVGGSALGVDIEKIRQDFCWQPVAQHFFHRQEKDILNALSGSAKREAFYQIWTQKEAFAKGTGEGLGAEFEKFAAPLDGGPIVDETATRTGERWYTTVLHTIRGHKVALASHLPDPNVFLCSSLNFNLQPKLAGPGCFLHGSVHLQQSQERTLVS